MSFMIYSAKAPPGGIFHPISVLSYLECFAALYVKTSAKIGPLGAGVHWQNK
jgi:hypothetical protein